ncbi:carboxymuconolactone decarboxylase family protein [bacterium]|nr:carboxymuconolactone decarboxylase family protein [bacterium]
MHDITWFQEVSLARIPYYEFKDEDSDKISILGREPRLNVLRVIAHAAFPVVNGFITLVASLLTAGRLDPSFREMAIVRTGILCGSGYEVYQHRKVSKRIGMPAEKLEALSVGSVSPVFTEVERLVLRFTEEIVTSRKASEDTFRALSAQLSHAELVELTMVIGCYVMVSSFLLTFEVEIEQKKAGREEG